MNTPKCEILPHEQRGNSLRTENLREAGPVPFLRW